MSNFGTPTNQRRNYPGLLHFYEFPYHRKHLHSTTFVRQAIPQKRITKNRHDKERQNNIKDFACNNHFLEFTFVGKPK